ncbi:lactate utilization protein [Candidatus Falkowbacteria bacterium HGW-Falkowbacteria-2]|uniref:Lactate utilization protein n=1 Tax=Candidatus Falkowbacteria bacterium HGW-Falkowbacteria-2 TaxID=2013769 RepID=A0A2N2E3P8_9BACT|nr:MAG: lactate utilization protein [Candidatus Falkowbacteria bacterium HGW-Falkowbacteria-2]
MDYNKLASEDVIKKTVAALEDRGVEVIIVDSAEKALKNIISLIPKGSSIMNGSSTTLRQIGFIDYLKVGNHKWNNLHEAVLAEKDETKQAALRQHSVLSDYYLGSVHALAETGEYLVASNTGSQLPHIAYTSNHLILVISTKKITPTLADAYRRLTEHVVPLEDARMQEAYGFGTQLNKILVVNGENSSSGRKIVMILVKENLGY